MATLDENRVPCATVAIGRLLKMFFRRLMGNGEIVVWRGEG
jgi:hypothetical protein